MVITSLAGTISIGRLGKLAGNSLHTPQLIPQTDLPALGRLVLYRTALVVTAMWTHLMRLLHFMAVRTLAGRWLGQKVMRSPCARPPLRVTSFRVRHSNTPRFLPCGRIV